MLLDTSSLNASSLVAFEFSLSYSLTSSTSSSMHLRHSRISFPSLSYGPRARVLLYPHVPVWYSLQFSRVPCIARVSFLVVLHEALCCTTDVSYHMVASPLGIETYHGGIVAAITLICTVKLKAALDV